MSWLRIEPIDVRDGRATKVWDVFAASGGDLLGRVAWYAPWRKYTFFTGGSTTAYARQTIWEEDCLRELATFCEKATIERRRLWRTRKPRAGR